MSLAPTYESIRRETSRKPLIREKPAKYLGTRHQCKDGYCHQLSVIFESVETFIRIVGLYLGVIPPICILVLRILWFFTVQFIVLCVLIVTLQIVFSFLLWTLIDSFIWNEIVHGISCDISRWYHQYDAYSTPIKWSRITLSYLPGSVGVACSPILSVSFEGIGCEPVLNIAATPDEAVSIIVCELYYWLASVQ